MVYFDGKAGMDLLRICVTGDEHIGLRYARYAHAAELVAARLDSLERVTAAADREDCGLLVVTGDLFESTGVPRRDVYAVVERLAAFRGTVAVLPGNHDHYDGSARVWQYFEEAARERDNILLMKEYRPYPLRVGEEDVVLYPAFCPSRRSAPGENAIGWLRGRSFGPDGAYHIGVAHGAVEGETIDREGAYFMMSRAELEAIGVDVWLIGHTHVPFPRELREDAYTEAGRIFNAGTHMQTDVNCATEGLCFILELDGGHVRAKKVRTGTVRFYRRAVRASAGKLAQRVAEAVEDIPDAASVELILSGAVTAEEYARRDEIAQAALSRFLEGDYDDRGLVRLITKEVVDAAFPETSFAAGLLTELLDEPKQAQLMYDLLLELGEGAR